MSLFTYSNEPRAGGLFKPLITQQDRANAIDEIRANNAKIRSVVEGTSEAEQSAIQEAYKLQLGVEKRKSQDLQEAVGELADEDLDALLSLNPHALGEMDGMLKALTNHSLLNQKLYKKVKGSMDRIQQNRPLHTRAYQRF